MEWQAIASIIASVLTLVGVIITVEKGNRVRDIQTDNKIESVTTKMSNDITSLSDKMKMDIEAIHRSIASLEKKQDAHNDVITRMYKAEQDIALIKEHGKSQDDDIHLCKQALGAWREEIKPHN